MSTPKKILLIEDDPDQVLMYELEFTKNGYLVFTADKKAAAFEIIRREKPDLVFLDLLLGEEKGQDILKEIKTSKETRGAKVIILSNFNQKDQRSILKKAGALDFFNKSEFMPKEIVAKAGEYLS